MIPVVSASLMRRSDLACLTPQEVLVGRAADAMVPEFAGAARCAVVCGNGNNGADGFALAAKLTEEGKICRVLRISDRTTDAGRYWLAECVRLGVPVTVVPDGDFDFSGDTDIADCLFGTGFHGNAEGEYRAAIEAINASGCRVVSADINSGLCADSGLGEPAVRSDLTVAFGAYKSGHFLGRAKDLIGRMRVADVGIPLLPERCAFWVRSSDLAPLLPPRRQCSHKGDYGYIALIGGCAEYSGAAKLANMSQSALRAGCGVATLAVPASLAGAVAPALLESTLALSPECNGHMIFDELFLSGLIAGRRAVGVGMGWGRSEENQKILAYLLSHMTAPLLIDADGLYALSRLGTDCLCQATCPVILTPHTGEFARLSGLSPETVLDDPIAHAERFAAMHGVVLLLKGPSTVVTDGHETLLVRRGCAGMATAGSGDVLSGILTGLLGYLPADPHTVALGAYLAGMAGEMAARDIGEISMLASDTVSHIAEAVRTLTGR